MKWNAHPILRMKDTHVIPVGRSEKPVAFAKVASSDSDPSSGDEFLQRPEMDVLDTEPVLLA